MTAHSERTRLIFQSYVDEHGSDGPIGAVAALLASGELTRSSVDEAMGGRPGTWLKPPLLDLLLFYLRSVLAEHQLDVEEQQTVRELKLLLRIEEGDFVKHRRAEVAGLLAEQLDRMLEDDHIDDAEALQQVELQRVFDLSYDDYLALTRRAVEAAVERLIDRAEASGSTDAEVEEAYSQLNALSTVYLLSANQRRRIGRRY